MSRKLGFFEILSRCLRSKCPVCGSGRLFAPFHRPERLRELFLPVEKCDVCGFRFAREPGYYAGVITPILPILACGTAFVSTGIAYFIFQAEIEAVIQVAIVSLIFGMLVFFRTAIAIYVALDHAISPPQNPSKSD